MTTIKKKAHLGDRRLVNETIPEGVTTIEDWAYAHCKLLNRIYIPYTINMVSPKTFDGCDNLSEVHVYKGDDTLNDNPHLLALSIKAWPDDINELIVRAKTPDMFYRFWDNRFLKYLNESDDTGFNPFLAGGEEDYEDDDNDIELFIYKRQVDKCTLIYERILSENEGYIIDEDIRDRYITYLRDRRLAHSFDALLREDVYVAAYKSIYFEYAFINANEAFELIDKAGNDKELSSMIINASLKEGGGIIDDFKI